MASDYAKKRPYHINGTATTAAFVPVSLTKTAEGGGQLFADYVTIRNRSATNGLLVSFDGGTGFCTLDPKDGFDLEWRIEELHVKSSGGNADYEIVCFTGKPYRP
jgi:hypothetical protein